jgi:hypothetical protein
MSMKLLIIVEYIYNNGFHENNHSNDTKNSSKNNLQWIDTVKASNLARQETLDIFLQDP